MIRIPTCACSRLAGLLQLSSASAPVMSAECSVSIQGCIYIHTHARTSFLTEGTTCGSPKSDSDELPCKLPVADVAAGGIAFGALMPPVRVSGFEPQSRAGDARECKPLCLGPREASKLSSMDEPTSPTSSTGDELRDADRAIANSSSSLELFSSHRRLWSVKIAISRRR
jgi:hypothetical protein